jgi:catalase
MKTLTNDHAGKLAGENPDYGTQKLFEAIESGKPPSWTVYIVCIFVHIFDTPIDPDAANNDARSSRKVPLQRS